MYGPHAKSRFGISILIPSMGPAGKSRSLHSKKSSHVPPQITLASPESALHENGSNENRPEAFGMYISAETRAFIPATGWSGVSQYRAAPW